MTKCITALAICVALLSGCSQPAPTVVSVKCGSAPYGLKMIIDGIRWTYYETYYWSDGTKTYKGVRIC